jgi:hypothetical protein
MEKSYKAIIAVLLCNLLVSNVFAAEFDINNPKDSITCGDDDPLRGISKIRKNMLGITEDLGETVSVTVMGQGKAISRDDLFNRYRNYCLIEENELKKIIDYMTGTTSFGQWFVVTVFSKKDDQGGNNNAAGLDSPPAVTSKSSLDYYPAFSMWGNVLAMLRLKYGDENLFGYRDNGSLCDTVRSDVLTDCGLQNVDAWLLANKPTGISTVPLFRGQSYSIKGLVYKSERIFNMYSLYRGHVDSTPDDINYIADTTGHDAIVYLGVDKGLSTWKSICIDVNEPKPPIFNFSGGQQITSGGKVVFHLAEGANLSGFVIGPSSHNPSKFPTKYSLSMRRSFPN